MALTLSYGWDASGFSGGMSVAVSDTVDSGTASLTGTYCHVDMSSVTGSSTYTGFAAALQTAIRAVLTTHASDYSVSYNATIGYYSIANVGARDLTLDFTDATLGDESGFRIAEALGMTADSNSAGGGGSGYDTTIVINGETVYSDSRPYYLIPPTIQGRSDMTDEHESESLMFDAEADDGTAYHVSKDGAAILSDWVQMAETNSPPSDYAVGHSEGSTAPSARYDGLALFKRSVTSACPWSYQHAWEHVRSGGSLPFLVVEGSDSTVHTLRADGASFRPSRFAGKDIALWSVPFKTRQLGTL